MKTTRAQKRLNQVINIAELFGGFAKEDTDPKTIAKSWAIFEGKLNRLAITMCNDSKNAEQAEKDFNDLKIRLQCKLPKLFKNSEAFEKAFIVNSDPRGYALKLDRRNLPENWYVLGLYNDWGGDIILSPEE